jgi:hypothetical protein
MTSTKSIYKSPEGQKAILAFYDSILAQWPVPNEKLNISTRYGDTFVIASGDEAAPPLVLLHGSSTNSAIWSSDVVEYSRHYTAVRLQKLLPDFTANILPAIGHMLLDTPIQIIPFLAPVGRA